MMIASWGHEVTLLRRMKPIVVSGIERNEPILNLCRSHGSLQ